MQSDAATTSGAQIAAKASFEDIRYAQLWEDADVLTGALADKTGGTFVSICSGGDNALALLLLDPERVFAIDLSRAQIACLEARIAAIRSLDHADFLELMGARPSSRRDELLSATIRAIDKAETRAFWEARRAAVVENGLGGVGKFERYFEIFRTRLLPLAHGRAARTEIFRSKPRAERERFLDRRWNNWRWRLLLNAFFSRTAMGRLGRDPAFFDHVEGSVAQHVARRIRHAAVDLDPADNPYLHWIIEGRHGTALPLAWRASSYPTIRERLDRLELVHGSLESLVTGGIKADGFNLSDIFEYMDETVFTAVYTQILAASRPDARLVYWNMMVPRRVPTAHRARVRTRTDLEQAGKAADKAFFYSDFVVEDVIAP